MGYWGWRPQVFALFISVWIVGCTTDPQPMRIETPSEHPSVTLMIHTPPAMPSGYSPELPIITTLTHPAPPTQTPLLVLPRPTCYEAHNGGIFCLGLVRNPFPTPFTHLRISVTLIQTDGTPLRTAEVTLPQRILLPGEIAPYHVLLDPESDTALAGRFGGVEVRLAGADSAPEAASSPVQVVSAQIHPSGRAYILYANLHNTGSDTARGVRVVATLFDANDRVLGYRIVDIMALPAQETMTVPVMITPVVDAVPVYHHLYVETE